MTQSAERLVLVATAGMTEYQTRLLSSIRTTLGARGIAVLVHTLGSRGSAGLPLSFPDLLRGLRPSGVIATNLESVDKERALLELLRRVDVPTVLIGIEDPTTPSVRADNTCGMRALMAHLLDECGVRRPALVRGIPYQRDSVERENVFRQEMARRGLPVQEHLVVDGLFWNDPAYQATAGLLETHRDMDAVVALNDLSALGAMSALEDAGLRVPHDVLVTGFDNDQLATLSWPGLTTVDQDLEEQGRIAAERLLRALDGSPDHDGFTRTPGAYGSWTRDILVPSRVVLRGSTRHTSTPQEEREASMAMAAEARTRLATVDALAGLNSSMLWCRTIDEIVSTLAGSLRRLAFRRLFLVLRDRPLLDPEPLEENTLARVILDYRDGTAHVPPPSTFPAHRLLPPELRTELYRGQLATQPLGVGTKELGYIVYERSTDAGALNATLHMDLSRSLEGVLTNQELERHASQLEQIVATRTQELWQEVVTRRRTEQELHMEVATRRRAEQELHKVNAELQRSLMLDGLTRIANRAAFDQRLEQAWADASADGRELALLMVDVDLFKAYNDHYGHLMGDETLRTVARELERSATHEEDLACRYGGEEFAVLLPGGGVRGATAVALRFRRLLAQAAIPHVTSPVARVVTASIGIAVRPLREDTTPEDLLGAADRALYRAKEMGRDRICIDPASVREPTAARETTGVPRPRAERAAPSSDALVTAPAPPLDAGQAPGGGWDT